MYIKYPNSKDKLDTIKSIKSGDIKIDEKFKKLVNYLNGLNTPIVTVGCCQGGDHGPRTYITFAPLESKQREAEKLVLELSYLLETAIPKEYFNLALNCDFSGKCQANYMLDLTDKENVGLLDKYIEMFILFMEHKYNKDIINYIDNLRKRTLLEKK